MAHNDVSDTSDPSGASNAKIAALTGLVAALGASSCCILPLVLFSVGVSGAWIGTLTALEPLKPVFLAVAAAAVGWGFLRVYRRPACAPGDACARPMPNRVVKSALWLSVALVLTALFWSWIAPALAPILLGL